MEDELNQTLCFTIPFKKEQRSALLAVHILYSTIVCEQEIEKGNSIDAIIQNVGNVVDKIKKAGTTGSYTLVYKEMLMFYEALYIIRRLAYTKAIQNTLTGLSENKDPDFIQRASKYYSETCNEILSFCNETFCNDPDFQLIRNTVELEYERQN